MADNKETEVINEVEKEEKSELEIAQEKITELSDRLLRTMAEYDNFRKRTQKEKEAIYPDAIAFAVTAFLPVLDNFERAMMSECSDEGYKKGVEMTVLKNTFNF